MKGSTARKKSFQLDFFSRDVLKELLIPLGKILLNSKVTVGFRVSQNNQMMQIAVDGMTCQIKLKVHNANKFYCSRFDLPTRYASIHTINLLFTS